MSKFKSMFCIVISYLVSIIIGYFSYLYFANVFSVLTATLLANLVTTLSIFIFSMVFNNSSVYDPYWSLVPIFIILLWINELDVSISSFSTILVITAFLIWGIRLTLNWAINWRGIKHEDWRYVQFRNKLGKFYWPFSFLGIHTFPTLIVFLGMLPIYYFFQSNINPNVSVLLLGFIISLCGVLFSFLADLHLTRHRNSKDSKKAIRIGIWKYSRHPNYLGEITFWLGSFVIGISIGIENYLTGIGFIGMVILFEFYSIPAIENRLKNSKLEYQDIINSIPRLIPFTKFKN